MYGTAHALSLTSAFLDPIMTVQPISMPFALRSHDLQKNYVVERVVEGSFDGYPAWWNRVSHGLKLLSRAIDYLPIQDISYASRLPPNDLKKTERAAWVGKCPL